MTSLLKKKPLDSPDKLTHDWYSNDSWPIYHRQLTDIPPTVDRYITDISCPIVSRGASSKYRPILGRYICRPLYRPISRSTLPTVNKIQNVYITVSFIYNFRRLSDKFPTIFWSLMCHILHPRLGYFFVAKREPKLFGFKCVIERGIKKILTFVIR